MVTAEKKYPPFRTSKNVDIRMTPQMGIIECDYKHLIRAFGQPNFSRDAGDEFDGLERVSWHIEFQSGEKVRLCNVRSFEGSLEEDYTRTKNWRVNTHSLEAYSWIKEVIRDANPEAVASNG